MSGGEEAEESKDDFNGEFKLAAFENVTAKHTCLYSTYDPEYIFSQLISKLTDRQCSPKINEKKWKLTYDSFKEQTQEEKQLELH